MGDFYNESGAVIIGSHLTTAMPTANDVFTNKPGGIITLTDTLVSWVGLFVNNGDITTANWINTDAITGTTGKFCVANSFINIGNITGTVDICDATPGTLCDMNLGTISSSVTYCAKGPCAPTTVSVNELTSDVAVDVYPNPSTGKFNLVIAGEAKLVQIEIYNISGEKIFAQQTQNENSEIDLSNQPGGIYFLKIINEDASSVVRKIIKE